MEDNKQIHFDKGKKLTDKWRKQTHLEFYKNYGAWFYFSGVKLYKKKVAWSEQFRRETHENE